MSKINIKERLDRVLVQKNIATDYTSVKSKIIHTTASDHKPVAIILGKLDNQGPLPFRYNSIWDSNKEFRNQLKRDEHKALQDPPIMYGKQN